MTGMEDVLAAHSQSARNQRCACGWRPDYSKSVIEPDNVYAQHRGHVAEALSAAGFGNLHDAWAEGVATALNHAIQNDDGITLRLEHLDGRPWTNPYPKVSES